MEATITFLGATGTVTGSRYLLDLPKQRLLIDCGLFQGKKENRLRNWEPFPVDPSSIDRVLLTHAHIDHTGYLPRLCKDGFRGSVHCTHATADLCKIMLRDSAHLQEEDAKWANKSGFSKHKPALPLYTVDDVERVVSLFKPLNYGEELALGNGFRVKFKDAGHILGSSFIDIKGTTGTVPRKIVFSGDYGRPDRPILRDPVQVYDIDYLILESTYGDRRHEHVPYREELARVISAAIDRGGVLVIPAFSVGRSQTLLYLLRELEESGEIPEMPVYMDSPMAINVTQVFNARITDQDISARIEQLEGKKLFHPRQLHICRSTRESKAINDIRSRAIIISASGMVTGGRILHHMVHRLPSEKNTILFMGYQAQGTRGRTILDGHEKVKIHGHYVPIRAHIEKISGLSGHGDYVEILAWLLGLNRPPERIFIVHGEPSSSLGLKEKIAAQFGWNVDIPGFKQQFTLDL